MPRKKDYILSNPFYAIFALLLTNKNLQKMKKNVIFLMSAILMFPRYNLTILRSYGLMVLRSYALMVLCSYALTVFLILPLNAQNPYCEWDNSPPRLVALQNETNPIYINVEEGCQFRFVLKDPNGIGWSSKNWIDITVDGVDYGSVTLPWGTPNKEVIKLLPSGEIQCYWNGPFDFLSNCFEIYNSYDELIYESPYPGLLDRIFLIYLNECPECSPLTGLVGEYNQESKVVHLSWVVPQSEELTGFDIFRNGELLEHVASTINTYSSQTDTLKNGTYKYCVVPVYPFICDLEEECFETYILSIQNYASGLYIYPNPVKEELTIDNGQLTITSVEIFDVMGKKQKSRKAEKQNVEREIVINISNLASGLYFVEITTEKGVITKKMIKQ